MQNNFDKLKVLIEYIETPTLSTQQDKPIQVQIVSSTFLLTSSKI